MLKHRQNTLGYGDARYTGKEWPEDEGLTVEICSLARLIKLLSVVDTIVDTETKTSFLLGI